MQHTLAQLRQDLAQQAMTTLGVDKIEVQDTAADVGADLTIPVFSLAAQLEQVPEEIAKRVASELSHELVERVEPTGGYINIWLKSSVLASQVLDEADANDYGTNDSRANENVLIEHTDLNPFKEMHIGHVYSNTIGEALARLFEASGAKVHRLSYHGDVGLHIAKAVWAMGVQIGWDRARLEELQKTDDIGAYYATGTAAYEQDESAKFAVTEINKKIYERSDETINAIYDWGKAASFAYFDEIYQRLKVPPFEKGYLESESGPAGLEMVKANMDKFESSDGAVVFRGEAHGEHTRVFITSQGLPTYESKDLALTTLKDRDYPEATLSVIVTANEINSYFKVVLSVLRLIRPELAEKTRHLSHGLVKLPSGKMSSRTGDVVKATDLLDQVNQAIKQRESQTPSAKDNALAAIKYAFLKPTIGGDIIYDVEESIKLEGQTGPYIQYAAVRIRSILDKVDPKETKGEYDWQAEKPLLMLLARYPEVVAAAADELAPSRVAHFAYELAKEFNRYYEQTPVKDAENHVRSARLRVLKSLHQVLSHALGLLNIPVPSKM